MKKVLALILASVCMLNVVGCGNKEKTEALDSIKKEDVNVCEYSFSGGNEVLSISNGHIYVDRISRFDGGTLEVTDQGILEDVTSYHEKYYVKSNGEEHVILSNTVKDEADGKINVAKIGEISSEELFNNIELNDLVDNLWYEFKTVTANGEEQVYTVQLDVTEVK